ncbi:MAG TPA: PspC domain-containing protein [Candidatus Kapabacteria bacterium]|nr:PspC domain-containing protein [Candidatus Kapabacteria bacterium]
MIKKLYRNKQNKMLAGVASGLADYFEVDPVIIRALFIIITLAYGIGVLAYIVLWVIVPAGKYNDFDYDEFGNVYEPEDLSSNFDFDDYDESKAKKKSDKRVLGGVVLITLGLIILSDQIFPSFEIEYLVPIILILIGVAIIYKQNFFRNSGD